MEDRWTEKAVEGSTQAETSVLALTPSPGVPVSGHSTEEPGLLAPEESAGGGSQTRSPYKPLKHWKSGECYRDTYKQRHLELVRDVR